MTGPIVNRVLFKGRNGVVEVGRIIDIPAGIGIVHIIHTDCVARIMYPIIVSQ